MDEHETKAAQPLADFPRIVEELLSRIDYFRDLRRSCKSSEEALNREENVQEVMRALSDYQARSSDGLPGFLAETALNQDRAEEAETGTMTSNPYYVSCCKRVGIPACLFDRARGGTSASQPFKARRKPGRGTKALLRRYHPRYA